MNAMFTRFKSRMANHSNSELEQAIIRVVIGLAIAVHFVTNLLSHHTSSLDKAFISFLMLFFICSVLLVAANFLQPVPSRLRRTCSIVLDMSAISYCMYYGGENGAFVFAMYLWVLIGNGLRFGKAYLWGAMGAALIGFSLVIAFTPYWQANWSAATGVYFLIVALPLYFAKLLDRLQRANEILEQRVEQRTAELSVERNKALASSKAKSQFLANMSHELRTPLNAIIGYSEMLEQDAVEMRLTEMAEDLKRINSSGQHLLEMIGDILDLSRIEAGKFEINITQINLFQFLSRIEQNFKPLLRNSNNQLCLKNISDSLKVESDETRLRQIIYNLLGNAIKFTRNGRITISVIADADTFCILVTDTGIGISEENIQTIFDVFTQVDQSYSRCYGGSGLGLAICMHYCRLLGGDIRVKSELGKGSVFSVSLPIRWQESSRLSA